MPKGTMAKYWQSGQAGHEKKKHNFHNAETKGNCRHLNKMGRKRKHLETCMSPLACTKHTSPVNLIRLFNVTVWCYICLPSPWQTYTPRIRVNIWRLLCSTFSSSESLVYQSYTKKRTAFKNLSLIFRTRKVQIIYSVCTTGSVIQGFKNLTRSDWT